MKFDQGTHNNSIPKKIVTKILKAKRIVIKIGTNVLVKNGKPHTSLLKSLSAQIAELVQSKKEVIVVSSGAIGFGALHLNETFPITNISLRQACASVGQPHLMEAYKKSFGKYNILCAQLLLTRKVFFYKQNFTMLHNCLTSLTKKGVVPIINENDSVTTEEINEFFGDNDRLSAMVAQHFNADLLFLLTDIDALYDKNPHHFPNAKKIPLVTDITLHKKNTKRESGSLLGTGGMYTKLQAAELLRHGRCITIIACAHKKNIIQQLANGHTQEGSFFIPEKIRHTGTYKEKN